MTDSYTPLPLTGLYKPDTCLTCTHDRQMSDLFARPWGNRAHRSDKRLPRTHPCPTDVCTGLTCLSESCKASWGKGVCESDRCLTHAHPCRTEVCASQTFVCLAHTLFPRRCTRVRHMSDSHRLPWPGCVGVKRLSGSHKPLHRGGVYESDACWPRTHLRGARVCTSQTCV